MGHRSGRWEVVPGAVPISRRGVEPLSQRIKKTKEAKKARRGEFESTALLTGKSEYPPNQ
jgi:hypothetical protein